MVHTCSFLLGLHGERVNLGVEVYVGSVGHGVHRDTVTEYQVVPGTSHNVEVHYHS